MISYKMKFPEPIFPKCVTVDDIDQASRQTKFGGHPSAGVFWAKA